MQAVGFDFPVSDVHALKDGVEDRFLPSAKLCKPVWEIIGKGRGAITKDKVQFLTMTIYFAGAGSPSKLQSKPIRWLLLDEVRNYPRGALETVLKRTRAFWNSRRVIISTPADEDDHVDRNYKSGDQCVYNVRCPHCDQLQPLKWEQMKWDENETTKPGGRWDYDELAKTIRYHCLHCDERWKDKPQLRRKIADQGRYVAMNPTAPEHRRSFHWNAMLPFWVSWRSLVEEFLDAKAAIKTGDIEPMRTFINESLGEPWQDRLGEFDEFDEIEARKGDYMTGDHWDAARDLFMGVDVQEAGGEHYYYAIRAFGGANNLESRLIDYGRTETLDQLDEIRKRYGLKPGNCCIDAGFRSSRIYQFCFLHKWKAFKGSDTDHFLHYDRKKKKKIRRLWNISQADPFLGKKTGRGARSQTIPLVRWSNPGFKDMLQEMLNGDLGNWTFAADASKEYFKQLTSEKRVESKDNRGRVSYQWIQTRKDNHLRDCELMILAAAVASGSFGKSEKKDPEK